MEGKDSKRPSGGREKESGTEKQRERRKSKGRGFIQVLTWGFFCIFLPELLSKPSQKGGRYLGQRRWKDV